MLRPNLESEMADNIIHIGYHKTATNWLQKIFYPQVTSHQYVHRKRARAAFMSDSAFRFSRNDALAALGVGDVPAGIILCEEELSGNIHTGGLFGCFSKEIGARIHSALPDARVVIFIRNQVEMIASVYKQYIKEGGTHGVGRYLFPERYLPRSGFQPAKCPMFSFDHFDYDLMVRYYESLFGPERVHVFLFEEFASNHTAFMDRYCQLFGLQVDRSALPKEKPNPPYGLGVLFFSWLLNHFTYRDVCQKRYILHIPGVYKVRGAVLERLNLIPFFFGQKVSSATLLGAKNVQFIRDHYASANRELAARKGLPLAQYAYPL